MLSLIGSFDFAGVFALVACCNSFASADGGFTLGAPALEAGGVWDVDTGGADVGVDPSPTAPKFVGGFAASSPAAALRLGCWGPPSALVAPCCRQPGQRNLTPDELRSSRTRPDAGPDGPPDVGGKLDTGDAGLAVLDPRSTKAIPYAGGDSEAPLSPVAAVGEDCGWAARVLAGVRGPVSAFCRAVCFMTASSRGVGPLCSVALALLGVFAPRAPHDVVGSNGAIAGFEGLK